MICNNCGTDNPDGSQFCKKCGTVLSGSQNNANFNQQPSYGVRQDIPEDYRPISMWGYFGYELLFSIPCIGLILLLVFSFGGTTNKNLKNFARSYFCFMIVMAILLFILIAGGGIAALSQR